MSEFDMCPYCGSKDIKEQVFMDPFRTGNVDTVRGDCKKCGRHWWSES